MSTEKVSIVSPIAKAVFPNLLEHEKFDGVTTGKYSLTLVIKPGDIKPVEKAIAQAGGGKGKSPLHQIPADAQYDAGMYRLKAKTGFSIKALDASKESIGLDRIGHGSEVRVMLSFAPYTQSGGGVTTYLGNIQLLKEGDAGDMDFGELPKGYEPGADLDDPLPF
jgi:hypothetical protein